MARNDTERLEVAVGLHRCGSREAYNEHYDAFFCDKCDEWASDPCGATDHSECGFDCATRPEKPSQTDR